MLRLAGRALAPHAGLSGHRLGTAGGAEAMPPVPAHHAAPLGDDAECRVREAAGDGEGAQVVALVARFVGRGHRLRGGVQTIGAGHTGLGEHVSIERFPDVGTGEITLYRKGFQVRRV